MGYEPQLEKSDNAYMVIGEAMEQEPTIQYVCFSLSFAYDKPRAPIVYRKRKKKVLEGQLPRERKDVP